MRHRELSNRFKLRVEEERRMKETSSLFPRVTTIAGFPGEPGHHDGKGNEARFLIIQGTLFFLLLLRVFLAVDWQLILMGTSLLWTRAITKLGRSLLMALCPTAAGTGEKGFPLMERWKNQKFGECYGIAIGEDDTIYVSDASAHVVRRIKNGEVSTLAGKPKVKKGEERTFNDPFGLCKESSGNILVC